MSVGDRLVVRRRPPLGVYGLEHPILQPRYRSPRTSLRGISGRRAWRIAVFFAGQIEAREFADDGVAADPDIVGNFPAGQPLGKTAFQEVEAFVGPGGFFGGHVDGPKLRAVNSNPAGLAVVQSAPKSRYGDLPLSRIDNSPSLIARRMPSSIRVLATPGTLVPWVPCLTSFSR